MKLKLNWHKAGIHQYGNQEYGLQFWQAYTPGDQYVLEVRREFVFGTDHLLGWYFTIEELGSERVPIASSGDYDTPECYSTSYSARRGAERLLEALKWML